jgi:hypothetical protein
MCRRSWRLLIPLAAACGYVTGTTTDASLNVSFFGSDPVLLPVVVQLQIQSPHRSYLWIGGTAATSANPQNFNPVGLQADDSLTAVATIQTLQGVELARATTGFRVQSRFQYGIGFQAGGPNPDAGAVCHQSTTKVPIPGFPGDTLFLWTTALPLDAVC